MNETQSRYQKARERVEALRGFYIHLAVYALVNLSLFLRDILASPDHLWFYWPLMGWGIAIIVPALSVFGPRRALGADWKERKIAEFMEEEK